MQLDIFIYTTFFNSSGVLVSSYSIGSPIYVLNFTGKIPYIGTSGKRVFSYNFCEKTFKNYIISYNI